MKKNSGWNVRRAAMASAVMAASAAGLYSAVWATPPADPDYWPMKAGSTWTLSTNLQGQKVDQVVTVTSATRNGAATDATLDYKMNGRSVNTEIYRTTSTGVTRLAGGPNSSMKMNPPLPIIRYPLTAGKSWNWSGTIQVQGQPVNATSKFTVTGPVTVKTPAGTFKAMQVHGALMVNHQGQKISAPNDYWFAPGVGLVKQSATVGATKVDGELLSYKLK